MLPKQYDHEGEYIYNIKGSTMTDREKKQRWQGKWIYVDFLCESKSGKTNIYQVISNGIHLGDIKWYASWRRYAFYPNEETVYEKDCLRDIANFLAMATQEHKEDNIINKEAL